MAFNISDTLKLLFPEYQVLESVKEHGFIAKSAKKRELAALAQKQTLGNVQQLSSPRMTASASDLYSQRTSVTLNAYKTTNTDLKSISKSSEAFDELEGLLGSYWVGSDSDKKSLCNAFKRPYVKGFDNTKPKNAILLIGSESRGKTYSVKCICNLLAQMNVFRYSELSTINMNDYSSDGTDSVFLSDLYKGLNSKTESVVFENIEHASLSQMEILYQLLNSGVYRLSKRYMLNNGSLVDASGVLNTTLVSEISANGKYLILTTTLPQNKILSILGNKIVSELGDVIELNPLANNQIVDLVSKLFASYKQKCNDYLKVNISFDQPLINEVATHYQSSVGIQGLNEHIEDAIYTPLSEIKVCGRIFDNENLTIVFNNGYVVVRSNGELLNLNDYVKKYNEAQLDDAKKELNSVIGLTRVKEYILNLDNNLKVQQMREGRGLKTSDVSMHMVFVGNPGTGKTTIARIVANYLKALGVLSSGHLCEVTRAELVGQYAGHTAVKTSEVINNAIGGVLFIDEAYSLYRGEGDSFGLEAIDAIVKGMEDNRDDLVVILAGYEHEMQEFLNSNSGLKSRFPNVIHFDDYNVDEMCQITTHIAKTKGYSIDPTCEPGLKSIFEKHQIKGRNDSGNGRLARNIVESAIIKQAQRIVKNPDSNFEVLLPEDFGINDQQTFDLEQRLSEVIGMDAVKDFVRAQYAMLQANQKRKKANIAVDTTQSLNMVFAGNPGTGKTTMARIVADMLYSMGLLKSGQLIETDKGGLIAGYVGQTAKKTEDVFKSALGGVLFIDEAYAITNDGSSFGQECIDTLVKLIEDYRGEIVVILAGYSREMKEFMKANSGLESRFPLQIEFPDYSANELFEIGLKMIEARGFILSTEAIELFKEEVIKLKKHATTSSGNGRMVRSFVEDIIRKQSVRIASMDVLEDELNVILPADVLINAKTDTVFDLDNELAKVVGLDPVKNYIRGLNARLRLQAERKQAGLKTDNTQTMHMIFTGNPGTGKTMMARIVANVLYHMNIIQTNKLVETDRSGLVAGYVGQTAIKTKEVVESAIGGVLFVDEAYSLAQGGANDFGREAIDTLVKMMDDNRDRLVVILAGYSEDMQKFLATNIGLKSRFANIINFPDYTVDELLLIADEMYENQGYVLSPDGREALKHIVSKAKQDEHFGNGRYVRNIFERSLNNQALRLSEDTDLTKEELLTITADDIREA